MEVVVQYCYRIIEQSKLRLPKESITSPTKHQQASNLVFNLKLTHLVPLDDPSPDIALMEAIRILDLICHLIPSLVSRYSEIF